MLIAVTSAQPREGKTGVAAAIARHFAYAGRPVQLVRAPSSDGHDAADAAFFGDLFFVPGSPVTPIADITDPGGDAITVVECDLAKAKELAAAGARVVVVGREKVAATKDLSPAATVITRNKNGAGGEGVFVVPEDRTLNGFSLSEVRNLLSADVLLPGEYGDPTCDYLVIAPISSDAGTPYFRRFDGPIAVTVRFDKTDMHLAALAADVTCLILTGGRRPSDYTIDAAGSKGVPVLLSRTDTENTVIALEPVFDDTRFQGERKLDRMAELLETTGIYAALSD